MRSHSGLQSKHWGNALPSDRLGPIAFEKAQQQFLDGMTNPRRQVSPSIAEEIDREVKLVIDNAHQIALDILNYNRKLLKELAQSLLDKEILEGERLRSQLNLVRKSADVEQWLSTGIIKDKILASIH